MLEWPGGDGFGPIGRHGGMGWRWHFCRAGVDCAVGLLDLCLIFWRMINRWEMEERREEERREADVSGSCNNVMASGVGGYLLC